MVKTVCPVTCNFLWCMFVIYLTDGIRCLLLNSDGTPKAKVTFACHKKRLKGVGGGGG